MLRVPSQNSTTSKTAITMRTMMMRLISNGVPSKRIAGGKNSKIEGPTKLPSSEEAASLAAA
jgi:hypothetical protein